MKAYKLEILIIDHDDVGESEIRQIIEDTHYPNWCIAPIIKYVVEMLIRRECSARNIEVKYYRPFKTGKVPCYRECKILAEPKVAKGILKSLDISWGNYFADLKQ